jgi:hypothetical protein
MINCNHLQSLTIIYDNLQSLTITDNHLWLLLITYGRLRSLTYNCNPGILPSNSKLCKLTLLVNRTLVLLMKYTLHTYVDCLMYVHKYWNTYMYYNADDWKTFHTHTSLKNIWLDSKTFTKSRKNLLHIFGSLLAHSLVENEF